MPNNLSQDLQTMVIVRTPDLGGASTLLKIGLLVLYTVIKIELICIYFSCFYIVFDTYEKSCTPPQASPSPMSSTQAVLGISDHKHRHHRPGRHRRLLNQHHLSHLQLPFKAWISAESAEIAIMNQCISTAIFVTTNVLTLNQRPYIYSI